MPSSVFDPVHWTRTLVAEAEVGPEQSVVKACFGLAIAPSRAVCHPGFLQNGRMKTDHAMRWKMPSNGRMGRILSADFMQLNVGGELFTWAVRRQRQF